jgi:hypothetical protein
MSQFEIIKPLSVTGDDGLPMNCGWSRHPVFFYDPARVLARRQTISESDRYIVHSPTHLVTFEIRDDAWLGYVGISVISLRDKKRSTQIFQTLLPLGKYELPTGSQKGAIKWKNETTKVDFVCMEGGVRIIKADISKFGRHRSLRCALVLNEPPGYESLVTNQRWLNEDKAFRYTRCSPWLRVEGVIQFGSTEIIFTKGNGWGIFEWNRGSRAKADVRYWASACGMSKGQQLGFSVGYSRADSSTGTENGFFVDGKLHKLEQVTFHIPLSNWLSPWRFTSNDNRLEMTFTPHQERIERRRFFFYSASRHQVYGIFAGTVQLDDGSIIEFNDLTGFAERSKMKF